MNTSLTSNRAVGQFPISVPTSLAIEALVGIHPDHKVTKPPILKYEELWVNLRVLFRNFISSIDRDAIPKIKPSDIASVLEEEMGYIESIIKEESNGSVRVVFYYSNYSDVEHHFKKAVVRMDNTEKQKFMTALHNATIKIILDRHKINNDYNLFVFALLLKPRTEQKKHAVILTNYAIDLLAYKEFAKLTLVESHTGKLKDLAEFYTKFAGIDGQDLSQIPFTGYFLTIFGDKETFRSFDLKTRMDIIGIAKKYNWSVISTIDKIKYGIDQLQNPYERTIIRDMMSTM